MSLRANDVNDASEGASVAASQLPLEWAPGQ